MHRSGTSLITNWLNKCGLQLGDTLMGPGPANLEGHYEDMEFLKLHEEILVDNKLPHTGLTDEHHIPVSIYHKEKLKSIIKIKNKLYKQWGWKDPRTCLFLDTYKELLPDARYLIVIRDYRSVVSSLLMRDVRDIDREYMSHGHINTFIYKHIKRGGILRKFYKAKAEQYLKVWVTYNEEILKSVGSMSQDSYVVLNYGVLNKNDARVCDYLKEHWDLALQYFNFKEVYKEKLINDPIDTDSYISNKSLLTTARKLEDKLNAYITII